MQLELKATNKIKIERIELTTEGLQLTTVTNSTCLIPLELDTINDLNKNLFNSFKPKPFIWDFNKNYLKEKDDIFYIIDYEIFGDYFGYMVENDKLYPLRVSDAYLILSNNHDFYINSDLISIGDRNLEMELQQAIYAEDFNKAKLIQEEINEKNKKE